MLTKMDFKYFWMKFLSRKSSCVVDSRRCRLIGDNSILADSKISKYEIFENLTDLFMEYGKMTGRPVALNHPPRFFFVA